MASVLTLSRVFARTLVSGFHTRLSTPLESGTATATTSAAAAAAASLNEHRTSTATLPGCTSQHAFVAAASGFPKDMLYGPSTVNQPDRFGEDACFMASNRKADVIGVADGVGGWRTYGVDPSDVSRGLMSVCERLVRDGKFKTNQPVRLIASSYKELTKKSHKAPKRLIGSSTACIVVLDRVRSCLHTANLGDSGFLVVRSGKIVHRSQEQQHYFNTPFQLSLPPYEDNNDFLNDSPESAETTSFEVKERDVVLVATDGLFDNLPIEIIEKELASLTDFDEASIQEKCNSIAFQARRLAFDQNHMSPFAEKASAEYGIETKGGKPDDITVILAVVTLVKDTPIQPDDSRDDNDNDDDESSTATSR